MWHIVLECKFIHSNRLHWRIIINYYAYGSVFFLFTFQQIEAVGSFCVFHVMVDVYPLWSQGLVLTLNQSLLPWKDTSFPLFSIDMVVNYTIKCNTWHRYRAKYIHWLLGFLYNDSRFYQKVWKRNSAYSDFAICHIRYVNIPRRYSCYLFSGYSRFSVWLYYTYHSSYYGLLLR